MRCFFHYIGLGLDSGKKECGRNSKLVLSHGIPQSWSENWLVHPQTGPVTRRMFRTRKDKYSTPIATKSKKAE